jgi:uncharacterized protein YegL
MKNDYTHIAMIIDRSGSMGNCWSDVSKGYEQIVKDNKAESGKCTFTVAAFDSSYKILEDFTDIKDVKETLNVSPRGTTALLDAVGKTITTVGEKLKALKDEDRPGKVIVIVNTDGMENASKKFNKESVKKLIDEQTNVYKWQFQFIGASLESVNEAKSWGFGESNVSTYNTDNSLATFSLLGKKMKNMRSADTYDTYVKASAFTDSDKEILNSAKS